MLNSISAFQSHPWHGISTHASSPKIVKGFVEILPTDTVKYEIDKESGFLKIDRPQLYSNVVPSLYGFIPKTLCDKKVALHCETQNNLSGIKGDGDPLDILILTEKPIQANGIIVECIPIGGLSMIDNNEADDKIIAVMKNDFVFGSISEMDDLPKDLLNRIVHYFKTYKLNANENRNPVSIPRIYDALEAQKIINLSCEDYVIRFS